MNDQYFVRKWKKLLVAQSCLTLWPHGTAPHQALLSTEFPRPAYWSGQPVSSPGDLPDPRLKPGSPVLQEILYHLSWLAIYSNPRTTHNHLAECQKKSDYHCISTSLYAPTLSLVDKHWHLASATQTDHPVMLCLQKKANIELFKDTNIPTH